MKMTRMTQRLSLYAWGRTILLDVEFEAPSTQVCRLLIAVKDDDITYYGTTEAKRSRHVAEVARGMLAFPSGPLVEADVDVDIWRMDTAASARMSKIFVSYLQRSWSYGEVVIWSTRTPYAIILLFCTHDSGI